MDLLKSIDARCAKDWRIKLAWISDIIESVYRQEDRPDDEYAKEMVLSFKTVREFLNWRMGHVRKEPTMVPIKIQTLYEK